MIVDFVKLLGQRNCDLTPKPKTGGSQMRKGLHKRSKFSPPEYTVNLPEVKQDY